MTKRERVTAAVRFTTPDFTPHNLGLTQQAQDALTELTGDPHYVEKHANNHIFDAYYMGDPVETFPGSERFKDDFGVIWNKSGVDKDIGVIDNFVIPEPDVALIDTIPLPDIGVLHKRYATLKDCKDDRFRIAEIGFSVFERAWTLCGMENLLIYMVTEPEFVEKLFEKILGINMRIMDVALRYEADGFHFGDDWGQQKGLIMGPSHWRRFIKPVIAEMYAKAAKKGLIVSQHSCGDISEIMDELVDIGLNVYNTVQPEIYDLAELRDKYKGKLTFWGGISTQRDLPYITPDAVYKLVHDTARTMSREGGYIAAPTHAVPCDVPAENIVAMIEAFNDLGKV